MADPTPAPAMKAIRIIKHDDPNFKKGGAKGGGDGEIGANRQGYDISIKDVPTYGMPSGPGFPAGDKGIELAGGKRHRKTRTFPKGILRKTSKIHPSRNPSKAPATRKRSFRLVSETKVREARKTARVRAAKTDLGTIRKKLIEKKIISGAKKNIPPAMLRTLYADAVGAGLLS